MSFQIFKENMFLYMDNQEGIDSYEVWSKKFTTEYDLMIRRGFQIINQVSIQKGNTELMENLVKVACIQALQVREGQHDIINNLGKAVVAYWTGATLNLFPVPIIPAVGTLQNIATTNATVTDPGQFPESGLQFPTSNTNLFLDMLITGMQIHLTSIKGFYSTISIYPGVPPTTAPGFLQWQGYQVPPAGASRPAAPIDAPPTTPNVPPQEVPLSPEQVAAKQEELTGAQQDINDAGAPELGKQTAREYANLLQSELDSNTLNAAPADLSSNEVEQLAEDVPENTTCPDGLNVVRVAAKDIGTIEFGAPAGKNWGGGGPASASPGRIDEMLSITGLNNQEKVNRTGSGYYWCAAAVAAWWSESGLPIPSGAASCDNWMSWGRSNGYFSSAPKIGAAVLYGTPADANHIGIVSAIRPDGSIITIEGNTSGGGFNRNGVGVFTKKPSPRKIIGYVHPPECS